MQADLDIDRGASKVQISVGVTLAQKKRLRIAAIESNASTSEIVNLAINRFLGDVDSGDIDAAELDRTSSRAVSKVLALIRGKADIGRSELVNRSKLSAKDLDAALAELEKAGLVNVRALPQHSPGPVRRIYSAA